VVCPVGIDIRDGLQMQCIACGLCIDACDNIMKKLDLPTGLIRYDTLQNLNTNPNLFSVQKAKFFRPRTLYYLVIISIICTAIMFGLVTKKPVSVSVLQERNPLYVLLSNGSIRNTYQLNIANKSHHAKKLALTTSHSNLLDLKILNQEHNFIELKPQALSEFKVFLTTKHKIINTENLVIDFILTDNQEIYQTSAILFLP
jgi:polyferredoxin